VYLTHERKQSISALFADTEAGEAMLQAEARESNATAPLPADKASSSMPEVRSIEGFTGVMDPLTSHVLTNQAACREND
jgi:hypothetical protein